MSHLQQDRRLSAYLLAARLALVCEVAIQALWPVAAVLCLAASLALSGAAGALPGWLDLAVYAGLLGTIAWLLRRALMQARLPGARDAERRLEGDSGLRHRPLATLRDRPAEAGGEGGGEGGPLWRLHQARARAGLAKLRVRAPDARLGEHDPFALRGAALLLLVASLAAAGPQAGARLMAFLLPGAPAGSGSASPVIQAWIQPPAYTGLAPLFLPQAGGAVTVPTGSRLTISMTGLGGAPGVTLAGGALPAERLGEGSYQTVAVLTRPGKLAIAGRLFRLAGWTLTLIPNEAPQVAWAKLPGRAGITLATSLPWKGGAALGGGVA